MKNIHQVIKRPIITEKSTALSAAENKYIFEVDKKTSKGEIKQAVEELFKVKVLGVKTANVRGKEGRVGRRRTLSKKPSWKRAVVALKEGDKIDLFEVGG